LPSATEFRRAWKADAEGAWSADNSGGRSRETGTSPPSDAGFFDVAGNLAEWLQPTSAVGETALVAGGSYLDAAAALKTLRLAPEEKRERARHIGFRVVVEPGAN
jgi:formylglycine-generating enzyme required for sulfatase activity